MMIKYIVLYKNLCKKDTQSVVIMKNLALIK